MRIVSLEVRNYKGIAHAAIEDIAAEPVVMISGRNGTGKSLLLEAIAAAWSGRYGLGDRVGPWGDFLSVRMVLTLNDDEWQTVDDWHVRFFGGNPAPREALVFSIEESPAFGRRQPEHSFVVENILRNANFHRETHFSRIDFLPATRLVPFGSSPTVDIGMLSAERVDQERYSMLDQFITQRTPMSMPNVSNYLLTLDYQALMAARQGLEATDEYALIAAAFSAATGKALLQPELDMTLGSDIRIEIPAGQRHGLSDLSAGEKEMLAMMYFVRRLSAMGGILLIDEPEQHLHPSLQAALFESMTSLATRAQVLVVSHSVNLISAAPVPALVSVSAPTDASQNQATRLKDEPQRTELIALLGITAANLLQSDMLLVVEGDTDAQILHAMFPVEVGRAYVITAGSGQQVVDACDTLIATPIGVPWLCIRDRDFLDDEAVQRLQVGRPNLYVWSRREIESFLIEENLLAATVSSVAEEMSQDRALTVLQDAAAPLQEDVLQALVEAELLRQFPPPETREGGRFDKMRAQYEDYAVVNNRRAQAFGNILDEQREALAARWPTDWKSLVDPKVMLRRLHSEVGVFHGHADLTLALLTRIRKDPALRHPELETVRARMADCMLGAAGLP